MKRKVRNYKDFAVYVNTDTSGTVFNVHMQQTLAENDLLPVMAAIDQAIRKVKVEG